VADFIDQLQVSQEERVKLRALGAKSPLSVLSLRKASQEAFDRHFGADRADSIAEQLRSLLAPDELQQLEQPVRRPGSLGARLDLPPNPRTPADAQKNKNKP
jgi:hypothetical protein